MTQSEEALNPAGFETKILHSYGLFVWEYEMLLALNDVAKLTFKELAVILRRLPKTYSNEFSTSSQRLHDSLEWLQYLKKREYPCRHNCMICCTPIAGLFKAIDVYIENVKYRLAWLGKW